MSQDKHIYAVGAMLTEMKLTNGKSLKVSNLADGCIGLIPVFSDLENAEEWAQGSEIIYLKIGEQK